MKKLEEASIELKYLHQKQFIQSLLSTSVLRKNFAPAQNTKDSSLTNRKIKQQNHFKKKLNAINFHADLTQAIATFRKKIKARLQFASTSNRTFDTILVQLEDFFLRLQTEFSTRSANF